MVPTELPRLADTAGMRHDLHVVHDVGVIVRHPDRLLTGIKCVDQLRLVGRDPGRACVAIALQGLNATQ